jgi:hypothetical protein
MPRLKSLTKFPPGEFQVLHPEAGMKQPFKGSFREAVKFELNFRMKNKSLAQSLGLPADETACEVYVNEYNAQRCLAHGYNNFVIMESASHVTAQKKTLLGRVVGVAAGGKAALSAYTAMFGSRGPVARELADKRAAVCAVCPENDTQNRIYAYFVKTAAAEIMSIIGALQDVDISLTEPKKVGICKVCLCPLKAKCFVPEETVRQKIPKEVHADLAKITTPCWIKDILGL